MEENLHKPQRLFLLQSYNRDTPGDGDVCGPQQRHVTAANANKTALCSHMLSVVRVFHVTVQPLSFHTSVKKKSYVNVCSLSGLFVPGRVKGACLGGV